MASNAPSSSKAPANNPPEPAKISNTNRQGALSAWDAMLGEANDIMKHCPTHAETDQTIKPWLEILMVDVHNQNEKDKQSFLRKVFEKGPELYILFAASIQTYRINQMATPGRAFFLQLLENGRTEHVKEVYSDNVRRICLRYNLYLLYRRLSGSLCLDTES